MRGPLPFLASLGAAVTAVACSDGYYHYGRNGAESENAILFGIQQSVDEGGATKVVAGYEFLGLAHRGGWAAQVFRDGDGDGTCYFERFDHRLGQPRVESGVATFGGGRLPAPGLQVLANQAAPAKLEGTGWATGERLTFDAAGFAMPSIRPVTMTAPRGELEITETTPAPDGAAGAVSLKTTDSVTVKWTPITDGEPMRVMVALETDEEKGPGGEVRCFGSGASGSIVLPTEWVARLFSSVDPAAPIKGHLEIASHRQATIYARGDWTVYVVAKTVLRDQVFTGIR